MTSTFSGLSTALSSLYAQRRALDTTGQNIANANTEGYSRQRVQMQAVAGGSVPAVHSVWSGAGAGVSVSDVQRLRDGFLESRGRAEHAQSTLLDARSQIFDRIENTFAEPSDTGIAAQLNDFWAGWGDVANNPGNEAVRTQLLERGRVVADGLNSAYQSLNAQWESTRVQLDAYVTDVNTAADAVAELNATILQQHNAGMPANELADLRDLKLMELAKLTGANTVARNDGTVDVFVGGSSLVSGPVARHLKVTGSQVLDNQTADPVKIQWDGAAGLDAAVSGGQLAAALDTLGGTIPDYVAKLDSVATALADKINAQHAAGYPMDGTDHAGAFFAPSVGTVLNARTIAVAIDDPRDVGASAVPGSLDGSNADALAGVADAADGPDAVYHAMVVELGVSAQAAQRRAEIQTRVAADVDTLRTAEAGVNLDEELTNMISFQRAYEAASRILNAVDETLDVLVNRTGLVGR